MYEETLSTPAFISYYFVSLLKSCLFVTQILIRCSVQVLTPHEKQTAPGLDTYLVTNKCITALVKIKYEHFLINNLW
jgi:hypothetical protein